MTYHVTLNVFLFNFKFLGITGLAPIWDRNMITGECCSSRGKLKGLS